MFLTYLSAIAWLVHPPPPSEYACRQIPYAIGQFTVNEFCHELAFRSMSEAQRASITATTKFSIDLGSGIVAGFAAAILSQVRHSPHWDAVYLDSSVVLTSRHTARRHPALADQQGPRADGVDAAPVARPRAGGGVPRPVRGAGAQDDHDGGAGGRPVFDV